MHSLSSPPPPPPPPTAWTSPGLNCEFKAVYEASSEVSTCLRRWLHTYNTCLVKNHPYLYKQRLSARPKELLFQKLHGIGLEWTNLAIRPDNLYVLGFANGAGTWFRFKTEPNRYEIPGSIPLSFGSSYAELLGGVVWPGAWWKLIDLDLSRDAILEAIKVLYTYDPQTTSDDELKKAVTTLVVFVCESTRFPYVQQLIHLAFDQGDGSMMDYRGAKLVVNWKDISCAILIWNMDESTWDSDEAINLGQMMPAGLGITNIQEALAEVYPILQAERCSQKYRKQPVCKKQ